MQKREQKQAAVQKQEMVNKQMANIMDKYVKRIDKSTQVKYEPRGYRRDLEDIVEGSANNDNESDKWTSTMYGYF